MLTIRPETPQDYPTISAVNQCAFGGEFEARLVENLRHTSGFIPELSLVAILDGLIVGHTLFTIVHIHDDGQTTPLLSLAPLAILPAYQNQGIGSALVKEGLERSRALGYHGVVVLGHPDYYPRFGFSPAHQKGIRLPFAAAAEACMVLELYENALAGVQGMVLYPPEFNEE